MQFLADYGLFLAKAITIVFALIAVLLVILSATARGKASGKGLLQINHLNDEFDDAKAAVDNEILSKAALKKLKKQRKQLEKQNSKDPQTRPNLFVLNFNGDIKASAVNALREEITAVLLSAKPLDEVLVRLESPGGMVNSYGLAASQLQRIKEAKLKLTVAVDKVAASGGYMMACVADTIIAAPFAVVGSIGVIAQLPNFHRLLEKHHIDFEQITAGEFKRTLSLFGENTKQGRAKMAEEVQDTHELFKAFIQQHRAQVNLTKVATGEHWYATRALELNLVDILQTSDDYLLQAKEQFDLYEIQYKIKKPLSKRIASASEALYSKLFYQHQISRQDEL